jgi:hypothetical protein
MGNPTTYKQFITEFKELCLSQMAVKRFQVGEISDIDMQNQEYTFQRFPAIHLVPNLSSMDRYGKMTLGFTMVCMDIARNQEDWVIDVQNNTLMILQDIFSKIILTSGTILNYEVETPINVVPFQEFYNNNLAGWSAEINIILSSPFNLCEAAFPVE